MKWTKNPRRTEESFLKWIRKQPSCLSGEYSEWVNGEGRCEAAHVRRASSAGTGYKPLFSAIPLTHEEHYLSHKHGERYVLERHFGKEFTLSDAREWFTKQARKYADKWKTS